MGDFESLERGPVPDNQAENAIVGSDETLVPRCHNQRPSCCPYSRIDDYDMRGALRKVGCGLLDGVCPCVCRKRRNFMRDIDDLRLGAVAKDNSFHGSDIVIGDAKISC